MSRRRYDLLEIFRWLPRQTIDCCRLVCRKWQRKLLKAPPDSLPLHHISKFVLKTDPSFRETYCTYGGNIIAADYARPTGLIWCAVNAFVDIADLRLTSEELKVCLRQLHASDRVHIDVLCLTIVPPYSNPKNVKSLLNRLTRHMKIEHFSLQIWDLMDAHAAAHIVFKCSPRRARRASIEFVMEDEEKRQTKTAVSFLGVFIQRFERLQHAKLLPNWTRFTVRRIERENMRQLSFWPTREESVRLPCVRCSATFDDKGNVVSDTAHAFNDKLNRRLTVRIGYNADDYRGQAISMEFHVDSEQRCVVEYPVRQSNLVGDTFCDVFCFLDRSDIDGCQLVGRSWHRNVRRLNGILPLRTITFYMKYDYATRDVMLESTDYSDSSQRQFHFNHHKSAQISENHDYVFLMVNAYVDYLDIYTLQCQPKQMARAWRRALESTNGSCVVRKINIKMVSAADWGEFIATALERATVRAFELNDAHYHYNLSRPPWHRRWLPGSAPNFLRDRCFRFNKNIFHPLLLRVSDLTAGKPEFWKIRCRDPASSGLSTENLLRLILDGVPGRKRLSIHGPNWDFAMIFSTIIQTFPKLQTRGTLPLRTELYTRHWLKEMLPSEWPTSDESETLHVVNDFTRQCLTIAVPWRTNPLHPVFDGKSKRAIILLENVTEVE